MVGNRLKLLREETGLLQKELASKLKLSQQTVSLYESNKRQPDYDTLKVIADFFNVSTDYLLGRTDIRSYNDAIKTKTYNIIDFDGLSKEDIKKVEEYIEFIKNKYNPTGNLKKNK